jgi:DNA-binding transcriptional LysR family regulator
MTLKQLEALYWAATLGSFALAAERLSTTQSSLSKRILELESELGVRLFDRSGAKARITDIGERVLAPAREMLSRRDEIMLAARGNYGLRGTCRIGVSELVAVTWLADLASRLHETYPDVALEPRIAVAEELLVEVQRGHTDFAVGPVRSPDLAMVSKHLFDVRMTWVSAPRLLPSDGRMSAEAMLQYPVLAMSDRSAVTQALFRWVNDKGLRFRRIVASNSMNALASLAASGLGICLLPEPFANTFIERGQLRPILLRDGTSAPQLPYFLSWRGNDTGRLSIAVRDLALEVLSSRCR